MPNQEFLVRRADRQDRQVQFAFKLELQTAIGDLAIAAEQIDGRKRSAGLWDACERGLSWRVLNKHRVRTIRYAALVNDEVEGHPVLIGIAVDPAGGIYVGNLTPAPYPNGAAKVVHVAADGTVTDAIIGLTHSDWPGLGKAIAGLTNAGIHPGAIVFAIP